MTFTYNGDGATDLDKIRFKIGDTVEDAGVLPGAGSATNFTDEEIGWILTDEGSINRTIAGLYEALATRWANYVDTQVGSRDEKLSQKAKMYKALADKWRDEYGQAGSTGIVFGLWDHDISENDPDD